MGGLRDLKTQAWLTRNLDSCLKENDELPHDSTLGVKVLSPSAASNATTSHGKFQTPVGFRACGKIEGNTLGPLLHRPALPPFARSTRPTFELPWASVAGKSRGCWIEKLRVAALVAAAAARVLP